MVKAQPVLVLTRPEPQSSSFLASCEERLGRPIQTVLSPILGIEPIGEIPDLTAYNTLIFTSGNGVSRVGDRMKGRNVVTVGQRTADLADSYGARATCLGDNVDAFLENTDLVQSPALHVRGVHTRGDLAGNLKSRGVMADECIAYDQVEQPLSMDAQRVLLSGCSVVPVFSPRSANLVAAYECHADTRILAISDATAEAWSGRGFVTVAARPDRDAMIDLVVRAF